MNQTDFENLSNYRILDKKPHLGPDEEALFLSLHYTLTEQYRCLIPALTDVILAYREILGDVDEGLDGDECENLADIIRILINDHEGNI